MAKSHPSHSLSIDTRQFWVEVPSLPKSNRDGRSTPTRQWDFGMDASPSPEGQRDLGMDLSPPPERQHDFGMDESPSPEGKHTLGIDELPSPECEDDTGMDADVFPKDRGSFGMHQSPLPQSQQDLSINVSMSAAQTDFDMDSATLPDIQDQGTGPTAPQEDRVFRTEISLLPEAQVFGASTGTAKEEGSRMDFPPPAETRESLGSVSAARGESHAR